MLFSFFRRNILLWMSAHVTADHTGLYHQLRKCRHEISSSHHISKNTICHRPYLNIFNYLVLKFFSIKCLKTYFKQFFRFLQKSQPNLGYIHTDSHRISFHDIHWDSIFHHKGNTRRNFQPLACNTCLLDSGIFHYKSVLLDCLHLRHIFQIDPSNFLTHQTDHHILLKKNRGIDDSFYLAIWLSR